MMNNGWKIWFGLLGLVSLYGFVLVGNAQTPGDLNEVGLGQLRTLTTAVIFEIIVLIVAVTSVGILVATEREARPTTQPIPTPASDPELT
jgi:hypothetical protein